MGSETTISSYYIGIKKTKQNPITKEKSINIPPEVKQVDVELTNTLFEIYPK